MVLIRFKIHFLTAFLFFGFSSYAQASSSLWVFYSFLSVYLRHEAGVSCVEMYHCHRSIGKMRHKINYILERAIS